MPGRLKDKVAIVTGAGSRGPGIGNGKAAAILFAREGARVLCVDAKPENAEETAKLIAQEGGEAAVFAADVARKADCDGMVRAAIDRWGAVDILQNNVGIESRKSLFEVTEEEWDRVMAVDLKSMLLATQAAAKPMVESVGLELREKRRKASPLGTEGEGWDVAWAAVYLASEEARWVTGQTLVVDGGLTLTTR